MFVIETIKNYGPILLDGMGWDGGREGEWNTRIDRWIRVATRL